MKRSDLITPEGTRDLIYEECLARRRVETKLKSMFESMGYSEVVTPGIEFYDVFSKKSSLISQEHLYKLTDTKGRLIVLRPDSTIPIARLCATRLKDNVMPLRLFYNQTIYLNNPLLKGKSDEEVQTGIELIGSDSKKADLEVLSLAISSLAAYDRNNFRIEIGDIGFFTELLSKLDVSDETGEEIRSLIEQKNYPALNDLLDSIGDNKVTYALKQLPRLFGSVEVFDVAAKLFMDDKISMILSNLKDVYMKLEQLGFNGRISVDLGIVSRVNYYTGIVFRGYLQGFGEAVLSGGRYNNLIKEFGENIPAIGFGINVDAISKVLRKSGRMPSAKTADIIVYGEKGYEIKAIRFSKELIENYGIIINSTEDTLENTIKYAKKVGINKICVVNDKISYIDAWDGEANE